VVLTFFDDDEALWTLSVPVYLALSQEAMAYDVPRGTRVTFVVRRGLVEVRTSGTVTADVDVGSVAPVTVSPSGRSFPARLEDDTTAIMVEGS
jgi:flagella basal body P-ring formation protein FlgA